MPLTKKQIRQRYCDKAYKNAEIITCACGCGNQLKNKNKYGRRIKCINGHNGRKHKEGWNSQKEWVSKNKAHLYKIKVTRSTRLKVKAVSLLGNQCTHCGLKYNGMNACVFQFHHKDPSKKLFEINKRTLINYSWERILAEIKKCTLLCANCHFIYHNEEY